MTVSVDLPDDIAAQLHLEGEAGRRRALEMLVLEGYRAGELSRGKLSELLNLELNETDQFLKAHNAISSTTLEEFDRASESLDDLLSR